MYKPKKLFFLGQKRLDQKNGNQEQASVILEMIYFHFCQITTKSRRLIIKLPESLFQGLLLQNLFCNSLLFVWVVFLVRI